MVNKGNFFFCKNRETTNEKGRGVARDYNGSLSYNRYAVDVVSRIQTMKLLFTQFALLYFQWAYLY
jgi:hypothetical protein